MNSDEVKDFLLKNQDYRPILERMVRWEEDNPRPDSYVVKNQEGIDTYWEYDDVGIHPSRINKVLSEGFIMKVTDTNSTTRYVVKDREAIKEGLYKVKQKMEGGVEVDEHSFPKHEDKLDGIFDDVIGFDDVKWLLKRGMTTDEITNFLLIGPPGSAKTVFLMAIKELEGASYLFGPDVSGSGFNEMMFSDNPKYVLIDEIDDMKKTEQESLSSYMETGIVSETKHNKDREMKTNAKTFAAANKESGILDHIVDRFIKIEFDKYTESEFKEVCAHMLPDKEDVTEGEAKEIAELLWERDKSGDVREAIAVARLSRGDPSKVIGVLDRYSGSDNLLNRVG